MIYTVTLNPGVDHTLIVPSIEFNQVLRSSQVHRDCGGKGFNVSRSLHLLGSKSIALGLVGGHNGRWEEKCLRSSGIETDFDTVAGDTRTCVVVIEQGSGKYIKVNESGPTVSDQELNKFKNHVSRLAKAGDYWVFSGSLPPGIGSGIYTDLIGLVQSLGAVACLDTSGEPLTLGLKATPYLIKPNCHEAGEIIGKDILSEEDYRSAVAYFLEIGITIVALSLGAEGLLLASKDEMIRVTPPPIHVKNPVGSGDSLLAGLLFAFEQKMSLRAAGEWGVACGSVAASQDGVNFGTKEAIRKMADRIGVG